MKFPQKQLTYYGGSHLYPDLVSRYFHLVGPVNNVLDLGCGLGSIGRSKPNNNIQVIGLDYDIVALCEANRWEHVAQYNLEAESLPFKAASFDAVLAKDILEHILKPWKILAEVRRVLVPGGRVLCTVPMAKPATVWSDYTHVRGFTRRSLRQMFEDSGFEIVHLIHMGSMRGFGRLNLIHLLPTVMNLPLIGKRLASNHELLAMLSK